MFLFNLIILVFTVFTVRVQHPTGQWYNLKYAFYTVLFAYTVSPVLCLPVYLSFAINGYHKISNNVPYMKYKVELSDLARKNNFLLVYINFLSYSVFIKLIPCAILSIFSACLINMLLKIKKRRRNLIDGNENLMSCQSPRHRARSPNTADQTTVMLLSVLILFLLTELPQATLGLTSVIKGVDFFHNCYYKFGELMDILALLNSAVNFILFCVMSSQFRRTFKRLFIPEVIQERFRLNDIPRVSSEVITARDSPISMTHVTQTMLWKYCK